MDFQAVTPMPLILSILDQFFYGSRRRGGITSITWPQKRKQEDYDVNRWTENNNVDFAFVNVIATNLLVRIKQMFVKVLHSPPPLFNFGLSHILRSTANRNPLNTQAYVQQSQELKVSGVRIREVQVGFPLLKLQLRWRWYGISTRGSGNSSGSQAWANAAVLDQTEGGGWGFPFPITTLSRKKGQRDAQLLRAASKRA